MSLRRVTAKERDEIMLGFKKEQVLTNMMRPVLKDKTLPTLEKIKDKYDVLEFFEVMKKNPSEIENFVSKKEASELQKIFAEKAEKEKEAKAEIKITSTSESGISNIQKALSVENADIRYLGSSKFSISVKGKDYKAANHALDTVLKTIEANAKKYNSKLEIKGK